MKLSDCHPNDRPREKLARYGTARLSDLELLMAIIGSGNKQADVGKIAREVLKILRQKGGDVSYDDLRSVVGLGEAKIPVILARRFIEVFCSHRKASGSLCPIFSMSRPLARSTRLRVSKRSWRSAISFSREIGRAHV